MICLSISEQITRMALPAAGAAAALAGLAAFLVAPERPSEKQTMPFRGANIAHRGLHAAKDGIPENSLAAFEAAVQAGYGVEFDVHLTRDGHLVVFHDDSLKRMCGVSRPVEDLPLEELRALRLGGTGHRIPLLEEVLGVIDGRVPVILELKKGHNDPELCRKTREALADYPGDLCIESFHPMIVRWWRVHEPSRMRGQLSCTCREFGKSKNILETFLLSRLFTNVLTRPNFIAYGLKGKKPLTVRLCESMGAMKVAWTSRRPGNEAGNDTVIFERYRPAVRYGKQSR